MSVPSPVQSTYNKELSPAVKGMPGDLRPSDDVSGVADDDVAFGKFLVLGDAAEKFAVPAVAVSAATIQGVALRTASVENAVGFPDSVPGDFYPAGKGISARRKGTVWVYVDGAFNHLTDAPFIRFTDNGDSEAGDLTTSADSGKAAAAPNGVRILTSSTGAGLVLAELNLPA